MYGYLKQVREALLNGDPEYGKRTLLLHCIGLIINSIFK